MLYYTDIEITPTPELPEATLMDALSSKLHHFLASNEITTVGRSHPQVTEDSLGSVLRLHCQDKKILDLWRNNDSLLNMRHVLVIHSTKEIPRNCKYRFVKRVQGRPSVERSARRLVSRKGMSYADAKERAELFATRRLNLPSVRVFSASTGQRLRMFVEHGPLLDESTPGSFSTYGLSSSATVPWF